MISQLAALNTMSADDIATSGEPEHQQWPACLFIFGGLMMSGEPGISSYGIDVGFLFQYSAPGSVKTNPEPGILCMRPANERRRYNVTLSTSSLIGCAHTQNDPWFRTHASTVKDLHASILFKT